MFLKKCLFQLVCIYLIENTVKKKSEMLYNLKINIFYVNIC